MYENSLEAENFSDELKTQRGVYFGEPLYESSYLRRRVALLPARFSNEERHS